MDTAPFQLPRFGAMARHAVPRVVEGTLLPVGVFMLGLWLLGIAGAIGLGLGFVYAAVGWRVVTRRPVPGLLLLGAVTLTTRSILSLATGSVFLYFLQPTLGTVLVATAFLLSVPARRPLAARIAKDFCPIPPELEARVPVQRFFTQISLLWAAAQITNAVLTIWLLLTESVGSFVVTRTAASLALSALTVTASILWFRHSMREHVVFAPRTRRVTSAA